MTAFQAPGVYVEEVTPAPGPIQGVSSSIAAFVGVTRSGPEIGTVNALGSYRQFVGLFAEPGAELPGDDAGLNLLANGVYGFFNNGGTRCYVTRVSPDGDAGPAPDAVPEAVREWSAGAVDSVVAWLGNHDAPAPTSAQKKQLRTLLSNLKGLTKQQVQAGLRDWLQGLNWKAAAREVVEWIDKLVDGLTALVESLERALDRSLSDTENAYLSSARIDRALVVLEPYDDISIVAAPGLSGETQWQALIDHCANAAPNRFAVLDAPGDAVWATDPPAVDALPAKSDHAAIYYPWLEVADAITGNKVFAPPSGSIAGVYARVDAQRGVFKAPANEAVYGALGLKAQVSANQQAQLNDGTDVSRGVNCIRRLNGGILVWGARTVCAEDADAFKYVSTRRTFNYIRQSLENGTQWAVFEPNTPALWGQIVRNVTSFLTSLWQSGGLFGSTAAEAFYVKCDEDTNPPDVRDAGKVVTEVGVAISKPAEFVVFYLGQTSGSATPTS